MDAKAYKERVEQARSDLRRVEKERAASIARFDEEISTLKKVIEHLAPLAKETRGTPVGDITALGLDGAAMEIFSEDRTHDFAPKQILRQLLDRGFDFSGYSNRMAYLHGVLKRLAKKGYLHRNHVPDVGSTYRWANSFNVPLGHLPRVAEIKKKA